MAVLDINTLIWRFWNEFEPVSFSCKLFANKIGYLQVPTFVMSELPQSEKFDEIPKAVVLDLRGNHGGIEDTLLEFAGHFEPGPTTMGNVIGRRKTEALKVRPRKPSFAQVPVIVLVDSESASAAEMMARHLQLSRKALVIGDRTSGRVNSSRYFPEVVGDTFYFQKSVGTGNVVPFGVQISVRKVVMADGQELEHKRVIPDVACLPTASDLLEGVDPCLAFATSRAQELVGKGNDLTEKVVNQIRELSSTIRTEQQQRYNREAKQLAGE
jgi:C-terminal processing protease CtpA/Prc